MFQERASGWGDVGGIGAGAEVGEEDGKLSAAEWLEALAQVGVVHLVLDDAESDPRFAADDDRLADRIAGDPRRPGAAADGCGFIRARARIPETTVDGHRGAWTLRNSSSAAIRPAQISSIRSQGTQCVGSPRSPSIRKPFARAGGRDESSGAGSDRETGRSARPRPRCRPRYRPSSSSANDASRPGLRPGSRQRAGEPLTPHRSGCIPVAPANQDRAELPLGFLVDRASNRSPGEYSGGGRRGHDRVQAPGDVMSVLHQDAVDQLVEPVLVVVEPDDIVDGAAARGRVLADALERDRAKAPVEVGNGPGLARRLSGV